MDSLSQNDLQNQQENIKNILESINTLVKTIHEPSLTKSNIKKSNEKAVFDN